VRHVPQRPGKGRANAGTSAGARRGRESKWEGCNFHMGGASHRPVTLNPARTLTPPAARTSASTADRMGLPGGETAGDATPQGDAGADIA
jgi:hypothetical protein